jgi:hypothetical protein
MMWIASSVLISGVVSSVSEKPEGYHAHHRQLRRGGDNSPTNLLYIGNELHDWIHKHPAEARELGWIVPQWANPEDVVVVIPDKLPTPKKPRKKPEPGRPKTRFLVHAPADAENGIEVLTTLMDAAKDKLVKQMNWQDDVGAYFVLVAVLHDWLTD